MSRSVTFTGLYRRGREGPSSCYRTSILQLTRDTVSNSRLGGAQVGKGDRVCLQSLWSTGPPHPPPPTRSTGLGNRIARQRRAKRDNVMHLCSGSFRQFLTSLAASSIQLAMFPREPRSRTWQELQGPLIGATLHS